MIQIPNSVPRHIAIVMDGNGRWASERGLPRIRGHEEGANSVAAAAEACRDYGVEWLTLYAFSMENWKRPEIEVNALMALLEKFLHSQTTEMVEKGVKLLAIGDLERLPKACSKALDEAISRTSCNSKLKLVLALSYGSRQEILTAVRRIASKVIAGELTLDNVDETCMDNHLYTAGIPDPDLLIRTSGEMRISNFLLWQLSYTEIFISNKLWPDFRQQEMAEAINEYSRRQRRFGAV